MEINQLWAKIIGVILLLYGVIGFFSAGSFIMSYGNPWHNVVHLVTGAVFVWAGFMASAPTKTVNIWGGIVYALVGIIGFFGILDSLMGLSHTDNWSHLVIGIVSLTIGWKAD